MDRVSKSQPFPAVTMTVAGVMLFSKVFVLPTSSVGDGCVLSCSSRCHDQLEDGIYLTLLRRLASSSYIH